MAAAPRASDLRIASGRTTAVLGLVVTVTMWGSLFPIVEVLVRRGWDPFVLSGIRLPLAALTLALLLAASEGRAALHGPFRWSRIWVLGGVGIGAHSILVSVGIAYAGGVQAALIAATAPAIAAVLETMLYGERLGVATRVGVGLAVTGAVLVILGRGVPLGETEGGEVLIFVGFVLWTWYLLAAPRWLPGLSPLKISAYTTAASAVVGLAAVWILVGTGIGRAAFELSAVSVGLNLYISCAAIGLGVLCYNFAVRRVGVTIATLYGNLVPFVAVLVTVGLGGPWPNALQAAGGLLIVGGVAFAQVHDGRAAPVPALAARADGL